MEGSILYSWLKLQYTTASSGKPYWERVVTIIVRGTSSPVAALLLIWRKKSSYWNTETAGNKTMPCGIVLRHTTTFVSILSYCKHVWVYYTKQNCLLIHKNLTGMPTHLWMPQCCSHQGTKHWACSCPCCISLKFQVTGIIGKRNHIKRGITHGFLPTLRSLHFLETKNEIKT